MKTVAAEIKEPLKKLFITVAEVPKLLPPDKARDAARDLETFSKEVTSSHPRRKWYELGAEGMLGAAKTVAN